MGPQPHTRRAVLSGLAGAAALTAAGPAAGQTNDGTETLQGLFTEAVIVRPAEYERSALAGFFVHLRSEADPIDATASEQCEAASWPADRTRMYEGVLVDREESPSAHRIPVYVPDGRDLEAGSLFVVNTVSACRESNYVGVEMEQIVGREVVGLAGQDQPTSSTSVAAEDADGGDDSGAAGPGFGVLATVGGLLGAGALARRRADDE